MSFNVKEFVTYLEDHYEVWTNGPSGNVNEVFKAVADYRTSSIQTVKKIVGEPTLIYEGDKHYCLEEIETYKSLGLNCKLVHVGPDLLNQFKEKEILDRLSLFDSDIEKIHIMEDEPGIFVEGKRVYFNLDEEDFYFYLSCIRYLAKKGKIKREPHNQTLD